MNEDTEQFYVESPWTTSKYKPDCNDLCFIRDIDHKFAVARYEQMWGAWITDTLEVVSATHWMYIPEVEQ